MADPEESRTQRLDTAQDLFAHLGPLIYEPESYPNWPNQGNETRCITHRPAPRCTCGHFTLIWETTDA